MSNSSDDDFQWKQGNLQRIICLFLKVYVINNFILLMEQDKAVDFCNTFRQSSPAGFHQIFLRYQEKPAEKVKLRLCGTIQSPLRRATNHPLICTLFVFFLPVLSPVIYSHGTKYSLITRWTKHETRLFQPDKILVKLKGYLYRSSLSHCTWTFQFCSLSEWFSIKSIKVPNKNHCFLVPDPGTLLAEDQELYGTYNSPRNRNVWIEKLHTLLESVHNKYSQEDS